MEYEEIFLAVQEKLLEVERERAVLRGKIQQLDDEIASIGRAMERTKKMAEAHGALIQKGDL